MLPVPETLRGEILSCLRRTVPDAGQFDLWLQNLDFRLPGEGSAEIVVPNVFVKEHFERKFLGYLQEAFRRTMGSPVRLDVVVRTGPAPAPPPPAARPAGPAAADPAPAAAASA
ncbi:MAG: hypothetical protein HZA54_19290, partial [Planctomycetes bacterium]|nr:hypothetical protein [Planctomycetota bacterium]